MKPESAIIVVAILIIGIVIVKNVVLNNNEVVEENTTEENQVAYRYDIEDQNFTNIDENAVEPVDTTVTVQNVIDVSSIEELRKEGSN
ncbi:MAG: hypothetical protein IJ629_00780 [Clostridia bacterium]|nr:hypothetical protein [Clostridia bacterium]